MTSTAESMVHQQLLNMIEDPHLAKYVAMQLRQRLLERNLACKAQTSAMPSADTTACSTEVPTQPRPGPISLRLIGLPEHWQVIELSQALQCANISDICRICIEQPGVAMVQVYSRASAARCMALYGPILPQSTASWPFDISTIHESQSCHGPQPPFPSLEAPSKGKQGSRILLTSLGKMPKKSRKRQDPEHSQIHGETDAIWRMIRNPLVKEMKLLQELITQDVTPNSGKPAQKALSALIAISAKHSILMGHGLHEGVGLSGAL